jgi:uncharacterized protein YndB with AHSA1/START domain
MENDFRAEAGHEFTFRTDPAPGFDGTVHCRVLCVEAPRLLEMTWRGGPLDTVLSFELKETPAGSSLTLRHSGFRGMGNLVPRIVLGFGWRRIGARLATLLQRLERERTAQAA